MGLFTGLLTLPLAPVRGVLWVTEQIAEQAERELYDEDRILAELAALESAHEAGEIGDRELEEGIEVVLARLDEAQRRREWMGLHDG